MQHLNITHKEIVEQIEAAWEKYLTILRDNTSALNQLSDTLDKECGEKMELFAEDEHERMGEAHVTAVSVLNHLVYRAARVFTAPGCTPIAVDPKSWQREYLEDLYTFSPVALWKALENEYGGGKGVNTTYSKAAREIVNRFGLHRHHEVKTKPGCHVLNSTIWIDEFDKKNYNKTVLSYHSRDEIEKLCTNLATFARWAGDEKQAIQLENACSNFSLTRGKFESRERRTLSDDIQVTCYLSRFEFLVRDTLADQLKVFVSTYASEMFREVA